MIKNTTFLYIILLALCAVAMTDFGSPASIATLGVASLIALVGFIKWLHNKCLRKHPLNLVKYKLQDDISKKDLFENAVGKGTVYDVLFGDKPALNGKMQIKEGVYLLFLELSPKLPLSITSINLRFQEGGKNIPRIIDLQDANQETYGKFRGMYEGTGWGWKGLYSTPIHVARGKNIYYFACFTTDGVWEGKLSLQFSFVGADARSVKIPCVVGGKEDVKEKACYNGIKIAGYLCQTPGLVTSGQSTRNIKGSTESYSPNVPCFCGSGMRYRDCCKIIESLDEGNFDFEEVIDGSSN